MLITENLMEGGVSLFVLHSRSISVDPEGVDAVGGVTAALQEGTVVADLHALTGVVAALEQLNAIVLSVLRGRNMKGRW